MVNLFGMPPLPVTKQITNVLGLTKFPYLIELPKRKFLADGFSLALFPNITEL